MASVSLSSKDPESPFPDPKVFSQDACRLPLNFNSQMTPRTHFLDLPYCIKHSLAPFEADLRRRSKKMEKEEMKETVFIEAFVPPPKSKFIEPCY